MPELMDYEEREERRRSNRRGEQVPEDEIQPDEDEQYRPMHRHRNPAPGAQLPMTLLHVSQGRQQPAVHLPPLSNSIVFPERGMCTGTFTAFMNASVLLPGRTFPFTVPTSLACEAMTDAGFTRSLMT